MSALPRLKRRREFLLVAAQGRKWVAPGLILQVSPHTATVEAPAGVSGAPPTLRVGFTVSRKVGNAVVRNRVRRRLRAAAEAIMPTHARQDCDYVVIGRRQSLTRPFPDLLQDLEIALRKVRVARGPQDHPAPQPSSPGKPSFGQGPE